MKREGLLRFSGTIDYNAMASCGTQSTKLHALGLRPRLHGLVINLEREFSSGTESRRASLWCLGGAWRDTDRTRLGLSVHTSAKETAC